MDLRDSAEDEAFRDEVRSFLEDGLAGDFAAVRGRGGPGDEHALFDERLDSIAIGGMVACAAAVFLVNRRA